MVWSASHGQSTSRQRLAAQDTTAMKTNSYLFPALWEPIKLLELSLISAPVSMSPQVSTTMKSVKTSLKLD
jgi:hypothetical protein